MKGKPRSHRTAELADALIEWISLGQTLRQFCREHPISKSELYRWMEDDTEFAARFTKARALGFDEIAEQCLDIANTPEEGKEKTEKASGVEVRTGDMLGHRKLQIETRLKLLAKWDPKRYGEKLALGGADDLPPIKTMTNEQLERRIAALMAAANGNKS